MDIIVRKITPYKEVTIITGTTTVDLGMMDADECKVLADKFQAAIDDLNE